MTIAIDTSAYVEQVDRYLCAECGEHSETTAEAPLYECGQCGEIFNRNNSYTGSNHQCPSCLKMASKLAADSCSECEAGEVEECQPWQCLMCEVLHETEDEAWDCCLREECRECGQMYHDSEEAAECCADDNRTAEDEESETEQYVGHNSTTESRISE